LERVNKARQAFAEGTANFRHRGRTGSRMLLTGVVLCSLVAGTRGQVATEYQIKAAFLFNFAKFVEWPPSSFSNASAPLRICVLGRDPFGDELRNITKDKTVNGRRLEVDQGIDLQVAKTCHILFIAASETARLKQIFESMHGTDALTVGDTKGFVEQGGMINFVLENNRVQFEVNSKAAEQGGLKISSKLLSVAKLVIV
jgi:YfiR/HmsC-like